MRLLYAAVILLGTCASLQSQEITMFQGFGIRFYQDSERISKKEVHQLLLDNPASAELWKKARRQRFGTAAGLVGEVGFLIWASNRYFNNKNPWGAYAVGIGSALIGTGFSYNRLRLEREAILAYNQSFDEEFIK